MPKPRKTANTGGAKPEVGALAGERAAWRAGWGGALGELVRVLAQGTSMVPALVEVADGEAEVRLQGAMRDVAARVRGGANLSEALAAQADGPEEAEIEMLRQGEAEGRLGEALAAVVEQMAAAAEKAEISVFEVAEFSRAFADLVGGGTSLVRSMAAIEEKQKNAAFKRIIREINEAVQGGQTLSAAMGRYPQVFDEPYVNAIRAGEINGTLDWTLHGLTHLDDIVTFDQAVQFLGTSKATLYRLLNEEKVKGLRVGRQWRFRKADLRAYLEKKPETVSQTEVEGIEEELGYFDTLVSGSKGEARDEGDPESGVLSLVNRILQLAIESNASDIHLEMARLDGQTVLLLRHRLDGVLHEVRRLPEKLARPIFNRVKVMADMSLEERAAPQDGRITVKHGEKSYDLRVHLTPTVFGGSLVMRILDQSRGLPSLDQIGLDGADHARLSRWLNRPNGLILFSGPTGSGKTTVLYTALQTKLSSAVKTTTIEDPVEYTLPYATQAHVNAKAGLTLASATRAFLRQDADVIYIAELRDGEIAEIALQAALTGHLMLSTLHARTAGEAVRRPVEMGVPPFLVSNALLGVVSQRLVRRTCAHCAAPYHPSPAHLERLRDEATAGGYTMPEGAVLRRGEGCDKCRHTGFRGRIGLYELLEMNDTLAAALTREAGADELQRVAIETGMTNLAADGGRKVVEGVTTVEEVSRVLFNTASR